MEKNGFQTIVKYLAGLACVWLLYQLFAPYLISILMGGLFAITFAGLNRKLSTKIPKSLSAMIITVAVVVGVLTPAVLVVLSSGDKIVRLVSTLDVDLSQLTLDNFFGAEWAQKILSSVNRWFPIDLDALKAQVVSGLKALAVWLSGSVGNWAASIPGLLMSLTVLLFSFYFFLLDGKQLLEWFKMQFAIPEQKAVPLFSRFEKSCRAVFLSLFLSSICQAVIIGIFMFSLSVPNAFLLTIATAICAYVPVIGSAPVTIGVCIYLLIQKNMWGFVIMAIGGIVAATSDNIVRPYVLKEAVEMNPWVAFLSVLGAVNLIGPAGIFLGPIMLVLALSYLEIFTLET